MSSLKSGWKEVFDASYDRPTHHNELARKVGVPAVTGLVVVVALVLICPPFAYSPASDTQRPQLSAVRIFGWGLLAAALTAALSHSNLFKRVGA